MASALLTVWAPSRHTVIDFRAVEALHRLETLGALRQKLPIARVNGLPEYLLYLVACRSIAGNYKISLRDLDRALWMWSKAGLPG